MPAPSSTYHLKLALLTGRDVVSAETAAKILSWRPTGFGVHSKVRTTTRQDAQAVARYMVKPLLALRRLSFDETQGEVIYQYGKADGECEKMVGYEWKARNRSLGLILYESEFYNDVQAGGSIPADARYLFRGISYQAPSDRDLAGCLSLTLRQEITPDLRRPGCLRYLA